MLRAPLRVLRPLPRSLQRVIGHPQPRAVVAAQWPSRYQTYRAFSAQTSYMARPGAGGVGVVMVAFVVIWELTEYFPSRSSPKGLMNDSMEIIQANEEVHRRLGSKLVGRGDQIRQRSISTTVEHLELEDKDGRPCIRIRYNLFGSRGYGSVFAEAAKDSKKGEFNFIYVQCDDTHEVVAVVDPTNSAASSDLSRLDGTESGTKSSLQKRFFGPIAPGE